MTMQEAVDLLGKRVWVVCYYPYSNYGDVKRGEVCHVSMHAKRFGIGEWSAYVANNARGMDYPGENIFVKKKDAQDRLDSLKQAFKEKA